MARRPRKSKKLMILLPDMSEVEARTNVKEGEHNVTVRSVSTEEGPNSPYLKWTFDVDGGGMLFYNTSLSTQSLWNLRSLLEALGVEIPDSEQSIDPDELVGLGMTVTCEASDYEGKRQINITDFWPSDENEIEEEDDDEPPKRKSKKAPAHSKAWKAKTKAEEPDDDEEDDEPVKEKKTRKPRKKAAPKIEDDEDEEEEPIKEKTKRRTRKPKKKAPKYDITSEDLMDMGEDELEGVIEEFDLDVELDEFRTLRKKRVATVDAAELMDVLSDIE